ncbi:MAG: malonyl-ACP O-methyltransferase BioC [Gammaproteobacteria bacterium]|nr:malonyl-ACP O-methyltransferase BioC [Gammaproteobacteria bacterium]
MDKPAIDRIDKNAVQSGFNRAAHSYDSAAFLQQEINERLLERLQWIKQIPGTILDLGTGTGVGCLSLKKLYPKATIVAIDLAEEMLKVARGKEKNSKEENNSGFINKLKSLSNKNSGKQNINYVCADAEHLPFQSNSFDLIFSNLSIQWCENYPQLFSEFNRILSPNGFLQFSTFGIDTLKELKHSWQSVSTQEHVNDFIDLHDLGDFMLAAGLKDPIVDAEFITIEYNQVNDLIHDLKKIGAQNHLSDRPKALYGKNKFKQMLSNYEQFKSANEKYPATYEVVYGHAWAKDLNLNSEKNKTQFVQFSPAKFSNSGKP